MLLLNAVTEDTNGTPVSADGGSKTLVVWSTDFGGGTVTVQVSPDAGTTWIPLAQSGVALAFTANGAHIIDRLGQGLLVRAVLSGSTTPDAVSAALFQ